MTNFGVLGLGSIAHRFCRSLSENSDATLLAVASSSEEKQAEFKKKYYAKWTTSNYFDIIQNPDIDVVYIATRHADHAYWVEQCLLCHKAVLCEKPMALSYETTKHLIDLAHQQNTFLMEAVKGYFEQGYQALLCDLKHQSIGEIQHIEASFNSDVPYQKGKYLFEKGQGGALYDVGIYPLSFVDGIMKEAISEVEVTYRRHPLVDVDSYFKAVLHFPSGRQATIEGAIDENKEKKAIITGTQGRIEIPFYYRLQRYTLYNENGKIVKNYAYDVDDMQGEIKEVIKCLKYHLIESPSYPHEKMLYFSKVIDMIKEKMVVQDD